MPWWIWMILGFVLLASEVFIPLDFFLVFIGLAGLITGALAYLNVISPEWLQWTAFALLSLTLFFTVRKPMLERLHASSPDSKEELEGDLVAILEDIQPNQLGKGETRGSNWNVRNEREEVLKAGERYPVSSRDGLTLIVK